MSGTNDPYYTQCSKCNRETLWMVSRQESDGISGYSCNSCGTLTSPGQEVFETITKNLEVAKAK